jgi:hypothetical protein
LHYRSQGTEQVYDGSVALIGFKRLLQVDQLPQHQVRTHGGGDIKNVPRQRARPFHLTLSDQNGYQRQLPNA